MKNDICSAFLDTVAANGSVVALRYKEQREWKTLTWAELADKVARFAGGLHAEGVQRGDRVTLLLGNRPEFFIADLAALFCGATPISLYQTSSAEQIADLCERANSKLLIDEHVFVTIDGPAIDLAAAASKVAPTDLATIIFTSGTTAKPKGVMLTHANVTAMVQGTLAVMGIDLQGKRVVSYLPLAHIAERSLSYYLPVFTAMEVTTCPDPSRLAGYLTATRPNLFFGVPRVWEKLHDSTVRALSTKRFVRGALKTANVFGRGGRALAQPLVKQVLAKLGLDQVQFAASGAAPLGDRTAHFFASLGLDISEIYGMSETCGPLTWSPSNSRIGTVGKPLPGIEVKLLPDGEIVARGATVFTDYLDDESATDAAKHDGWLCTGDIGEVDKAGRLRIVDRKKDLIITTGGKNISPVAIETKLEAHPGVAHACVIGDRRAYIVAVIALDSSFVSDDNTHDLIATHLESVNRSLSAPERIKKYRIVDDAWTPGSEVLTATMKVKRPGVLNRYATDIAAMYGDTPSSKVA